MRIFAVIMLVVNMFIAVAYIGSETKSPCMDYIFNCIILLYLMLSVLFPVLVLMIYS